LTLLRYLLVQIVAYGLDLGTFQALIASGVSGPLLANLAGKVPAGIFAFLAHRHFTFRVRDAAGVHREAIKYFILLLINAPLSSLILAGLLRVMTHVTLAKILADVLSVGLTFMLTKHLVFARRPDPGPSATDPNSRNDQV
jgi:putative flippase GtrA